MVSHPSFLQTGSRILKLIFLTWFHYFVLTFPFLVLSVHLLAWLCFSLYAYIIKMVSCLFCPYINFLCSSAECSLLSSLTETCKSKPQEEAKKMATASIFVQDRVSSVTCWKEGRGMDTNTPVVLYVSS